MQDHFVTGAANETCSSKHQQGIDATSSRTGNMLTRTGSWHWEAGFILTHERDLSGHRGACITHRNLMII